MRKALRSRFTAKPGNADTIAAMLLDYAASVRAEPGCLVFDPFREEADPDRFCVFEVYEDDAAFRAHLSAPYGGPFNERLAPLIEEPESVLIFLTPLEA